ncbi:MAG TPA: hypothetical protein VJT71_06065 [Pyrinomonadaceae bacterium]|nr:hypothetical protein [Pyrinomonadaceae bacterium]
MKLLGLFVALSIICIGLLALIAPDRFMAVAAYTVTPKGLYVIAALRVIFGVVLLTAASASRLPKTMRIIGVIALIAGLTTPLMGADQARAILNWSSARGTAVIRVWSAIALLAATLITYAFVGHRRAA